MSVINTNVKALTAQASLSNVEKMTATTMERLSTGLRINSAKDDAAGLAITNRMTSQIRGYAVAIRNSNDGISMAQTAEGAMGQVTNMLQRMRELSVQAATGSLNDSDRVSVQQEIDQLKAEIDNVANKTNHNNIKLLDGSAGKIVLQTGTNANDTMNIAFGSVKTKDIGLGARASLSSVATNFAANAAPDLEDGDLILNGVVVGASLATDDSKSSAANASSAIAKAAAINRVSAQSGVYATVNETVAFGSVMTAAASNGTIKINGVDTATLYTTDDAELSRAAVITAINNISGQTGVKAINTHDDSQGVVLVAEDGRNIEIDLGSLTAAATGLGASNVYAGTYELNTLDGRAINVSSNVSGTLTNSGLNFGTFAADTAQAVTLKRASTDAAPTEATTGLLNGNTLVINGVGIDAANANDDQASNTVVESSVKSASAIAIAAAINKKTGMTGVSATAEPNILKGSGFTAGTVTALNLNGEDVAISLDANSSRDDVITAINAAQGRTGVVASAWGEGITLTAADGRNISISSDATDAAALGLTGLTLGTAGDDTDAVTFYSTVKLSSDKAFTLESGSEGNDNFAALGFRRGTFGGSDNALKVADINVTTQAGATDAIKALDAALNSVAADQARAGAFQNRLDAVVSNLTESNQNMSASRSRILDTDYATETSNMAKQQIISQAATAMLAQANQSAQSVLSLLK
ncbi:MAG: flagellin [Betaproteobacteria bacterium]|nr:flagellin [Betaproteobacteria bacterium]